MRDAVDLAEPGRRGAAVHAALTAPDVGFAVVYGISANTRAWWDLAPARALGYLSVDDAEEYADGIPGGGRRAGPGRPGARPGAAARSPGPASTTRAGAAGGAGRASGGRPGAGRADLRAAAERWLAEDPDPVTRDELRALLGRRTTRPRSRTGSPAGWSSAPPGCAGRCGPARTG